MHLRSLLALGLVVFVAGCATVTPEQRRAMDEQECLGFGFKPGTDAFAGCLQRIELDRRADRRAQMAAMDRWNEPVVIYRPIIVEER
ncbi:hypothetical protein NTH_04054 [Nitratireductor thuwali]|uniref:Lipoprotein n=2 Tax=Nitratireductor thuwali TaxID=2267699 RepID=A0ABY5MNJ1_9HYPH|nr:hypothetical protein NTH_04054 [Nitratireductor thuwali]